MVDEGMDPCECIWGHELAMRRLLNLLRNSQAYCTETECFEEGAPREGATDNVLLLTLLMMASLVLYYFRPKTTRNPSDLKARMNNNDFNGAPPSPPPAAI